MGGDRLLGRPTRRQTILPLALVLTSLLSLVLLPVITMQATESIRDDIATLAEPARSQVTRIQNAIALESATVRGYVLTGDPEVARHHLQARRARDAALVALDSLDERTTPVVRREIAELVALLRQAEPVLDSLFDGSLDRESFGDFSVRQDRLEGVLAATAEVDRAIGAAVAQRLERIGQIEAVNVTLTIVLVLLALVAALLVARLGQRLGESEERFRQLAEAVHDFVWLSDKDFAHHLFANAAYERIWGRSRDELYANPRSLLEGVHPEDRDRVRDAIDHLPRGPYNIEFRVVRPDGSQRWVSSRGFPIRDASGDIYRVAGITEDITDRKHAAESRTRLIRGFTHDVKNPLGAADGFLALLEEGIQGPLSPQQAESVSRVRRSIRAALDLTERLLEIARAEAGQLDVEFARMPVAETVRDVTDEFRAKAEAKGLTLVFENADAPHFRDLTIESDRARVRQMLANLLSNAVKYTPSGGITVRVAERGDEDAPASGEWLTIAVADTGPGVPPEKQAMLFREFTRFDPNAAEGAGIGLAISQRIAEALGGTLTFTNAEAGSVFTLWLPCRRQSDRSDRKPRAARAARAGGRAMR